MSTRSRTPEHYPRMKVRGARRRYLAPFQRMTGSFRFMVAEFANFKAALVEANRIIAAAVPQFTPITEEKEDAPA